MGKKKEERKREKERVRRARRGRWMGHRNRYEIGPNLDVMREIPDQTFQCCVTSPPYWGLRDYGHDGQLGLEPTPDEYVARMVEVFREVRRLLRRDGTLWLNVGDSYANSSPSGPQGSTGERASRTYTASGLGSGRFNHGLKPKDLVGIPWRLAFALQADGWWLRSDIIWHKPNPMPESVKDRPTSAHEHVFLLAKSAKYYYDADSIREPAVPQKRTDKIGYRCPKDLEMVGKLPGRTDGRGSATSGLNGPTGDTRNRRNVWTIAPKPYEGAHFAVFPPALIEPCIKAGCPPEGIVLDPFFGSGTTGVVAESLGRSWFGIELNPDYAPLIDERIKRGRSAQKTTELSVELRRHNKEKENG